MTAKTLETLDHLSARDFQRLAEFIHGYSGIKMPTSKKSMVEGRLRRRVRALGITSLTDYCRYLFEQDGLDREAVSLIDAVSTNKTDFFREPEHFRFMAEQAVPELLRKREIGPKAPLKIWSAACSIGAEPYTLAMVASEIARAHAGLRATILATDINTEVVEAATLGIYPEAMIAPVPQDLRKRYVMRAKSGALDRVRMVPELRSMIAFGRLNLMEQPYPLDQDMHIIFCRNILIYFDKATQKKVLEQLCTHLRPGGFLFMGHSETLTGFGLPLRPVATTIFQRA
ncbi:CheR family methyltransferase [Aquabacter sp. CN5-332]|uniref:CheR family methyltransferase n=1 Tax=Aquabacter sp. CN5-332 TaxID=3156608 RepID=UPI0032B40AE6